jgi:hypothetical protein
MNPSKRDKKKKLNDDWDYFAKKDVYSPPKDGKCLDGKKCEFECVECGFKCRHGDCTWYCPLKLMREEEHRRFQELFNWMENRK